MSLFRHCPHCHGTRHEFRKNKEFICAECGFRYFHNTAAAVFAVIEHEGKILVTERDRDPAKGLLDLPGGFVDNDESLEQALIRELKEELNLDVCDLQYLASFPNHYPYQGIHYWTIDACFTCRPVRVDDLIAREEITRFVWQKKEDIDPELFGFNSVRQALKFFSGRTEAV